MIDMAAMKMSKLLPEARARGQLVPLTRYGVRILSCHFVTPDRQLRPVSILPHAGQRVTTDSA